MGRSGFNVPVFSDSAVNQSDERSGIAESDSSLYTCFVNSYMHSVHGELTRERPLSLMIHHGTVDITSKCLNVTFKMLPGYVHDANEKQHLFRYEVLNIKMRKSIRLPASNKISASKSCPFI